MISDVTATIDCASDGALLHASLTPVGDEPDCLWPATPADWSTLLSVLLRRPHGDVPWIWRRAANAYRVINRAPDMPGFSILRHNPETSTEAYSGTDVVYLFVEPTTDSAVYGLKALVIVNPEGPRPDVVLLKFPNDPEIPADVEFCSDHYNRQDSTLRTGMNRWVATNFGVTI